MTADAKQVTLDMCDTERMAALERSLEYVINRADGLSYALDAVPLDEPKMTAARKLLPHARWQWWK